MVRANSLLYAIYVCLLVAILCAALLYTSSLYILLNGFYNIHEELIIENNSVLTYVLHEHESKGELANTNKGFVSHYEFKSYGFMECCIIQSIFHNDTLISANLTGTFDHSDMALFVTNFSNPISYFGEVKLVGDKKLPSVFIDERYINNSMSNLINKGKTSLSGDRLPKLLSGLQDKFHLITEFKTRIVDLDKENDSLYFNSFVNPTLYLDGSITKQEHLTMKGNFVISSKDSIVIKKDNHLEDIIIKAPVIVIENGFKGTIQALATKRIEVGEGVVLNYPSVLAIYNSSENESKILIKENASVKGLVMLSGFPVTQIDENTIELSKKCFITGDIYSEGLLLLNGTVYGTVYSNRIMGRTGNGFYQNCIIDTEIDRSKRPYYYVGFPFLKTKNVTYGVCKKVL